MHPPPSNITWRQNCASHKIQLQLRLQPQRGQAGTNNLTTFNFKFSSTYYFPTTIIISSSTNSPLFLINLTRNFKAVRRSRDNHRVDSILHDSFFPKISSEYLFFLLLRSKNFTFLFISDGYPEFIVNPPPSTNNNTWRHLTPLTILQLHAASSQGGGCWRSSQGAVLILQLLQKVCYYYVQVKSIQKLTFFHSLARVNLPAGRSSANSAATQFLVPTSFKMQSSHASTFQFQIQSYLPLAKNYSREGPAKLAATQFLSTTLHYYIIPIPRHPRSFFPLAQKLPREEREPDSPRLKFQLGSCLIYFFSYLTNNTRINLCPLKR